MSSDPRNKCVSCFHNKDKATLDCELLCYGVVETNGYGVVLQCNDYLRAEGLIQQIPLTEILNARWTLCRFCTSQSMRQCNNCRVPTLEERAKTLAHGSANDQVGHLHAPELTTSQKEDVSSEAENSKVGAGLHPDLTVGMRVRIRLYGEGYSWHPTPRWANQHRGVIKRLNKTTVSVEIDDEADSPLIRADYNDVFPIVD